MGDVTIPSRATPPTAAAGHKRTIFWSIIVLVIVLDVITKRIAVSELSPFHIPRHVFGDWFQFTLVYNPGAAFGLHLGPHSRWIFTTLTVIALVILVRLYRAAAPTDTVRIIALGLVCGGAVGNLIDRLRFGTGVVDFIDIGLGRGARWPTFNVADMAVSCGAIALAWALWGDDVKQAHEQQRERDAAVAPHPSDEVAANSAAASSAEAPGAFDG